MAYTTIKKPSDYFQTELWSSVDTSIDTLNFQPDFAWIKSRTNADSHVLFDAVRGANKRLTGASTSAESTTSDELTAFNSNGYTLGTGANVNRSGHNYVSWNWLAGGTASSNTDGDVTSQVSANTTSGFSIVKWTTSGSSGNNTIGHGLGVAPKVIIMKATSITYNWDVFHNSIMPTGLGRMILNQTDAYSTSFNPFGSVAPTSTVFSNDLSFYGNGHDIIAYCFAEKKGFSKFGSYTGNGNADGTFVYTGFKPAFVITKRTDGVVDWYMFDNKRQNSFNVVNGMLRPSASSTELDDSSVYVDFLSNGFKWRGNNAGNNTSGGTYIYMAFAEEPLVGDNPATAR